MGDFNKLSYPPVLVTCFLSIFLFFLSFMWLVKLSARSSVACGMTSYLYPLPVLQCGQPTVTLILAFIANPNMKLGL